MAGKQLSDWFNEILKDIYFAEQRFLESLFGSAKARPVPVPVVARPMRPRRRPD
jgi:ferritin-like metal-binding protein YciE